MSNNNSKFNPNSYVDKTTK